MTNATNIKNDLAIAKAFKALGHYSRFQIMRLIIKSSNEGINPSSIIEQLKLKDKTLAFHLDKLKNADLVWTKKRQNYIFYFPNFEMLKRLDIF